METTLDYRSMKHHKIDALFGLTIFKTLFFVYNVQVFHILSIVGLEEVLGHRGFAKVARSVLGCCITVPSSLQESSTVRDGLGSKWPVV